VSLVNSKYQHSISEVFECFKDTENKIKQFEKEHGELSIPSINELRYVGYHFAEAAQNTSEMAIKESIHKALNHCKRAKFDTYEASSTLVFERLKAFTNNYSTVTETQTIISGYVEDLAEIQRVSDELQDIIASSYESRELYYDQIASNHSILKNISQKFEIAKPQIEALVKKNNDDKKRSTRRFVATTLLTILGIVALATIRLGIFDNEPEKNSSLNSKVVKVNDTNMTTSKKLSLTPSPKQSEN